MERIIILTPAIPRPNLHKESVKSFYDNILMNKDYKNYDIIHIINIDNPKKISSLGSTIEDTINNFDSIIPSFVKKIYINDGEANFTKAYIKLFLKVEEFLNQSKCYIIWLEDDWLFKKNYSIIKILNIIKDYKFSTFSLRTMFYSNNPCIYSKEVYLEYIKLIKQKKKYFLNANTDPDCILHCFHKFNFCRILTNKIIIIINSKIKDEKLYNNKYLNSYKSKYKSLNKLLIDIDTNYKLNKEIKIDEKSQLLFFFAETICEDIGRKWMIENKLKKWDKNSTDIKSY